MAGRRRGAGCARVPHSREAVLQAARAVVAAEGINGLSMVAVAGEAGMAVGSIYRWYASRTELVAEVLRTTCDHELDVLRAIAAGDGPAPQRLHDAVTVFARRALSAGRIAYAMICEPTVAEAEMLRRRIRDEMAGILAGIVDDGVADGSFCDQDPVLTGTALVGAVSEILAGPLGSGSRTDRTVLVEAVGALALRSAGAADPARPAPPETGPSSTTAARRPTDEPAKRRSRNPTNIPTKKRTVVTP